MVDLMVMVKRYYYDPQTHGSNSIKAVLPAILNSSVYLQEKYSRPIYGTEDGIESLNFKDWQWLEVINGEDDELNNGGAALTAYGRMQFSEMTEHEREELSNALLRYCELDTMAMVMIFEAWREMINE